MLRCFKNDFFPVTKNFNNFRRKNSKKATKSYVTSAKTEEEIHDVMYFIRTDNTDNNYVVSIEI